jgi:hypothetical protein
MNRKSLALAMAALAGALALSSSVLPASSVPVPDKQACLQNNRIWGWRALNERTLVVTDINYRSFLVHLRGGCVGLNNAIFALRFRTWTNLGCLGQGDSVSYRAPALGEMSCFVREVEPYEGGPNGSNAQGPEHRYESAEGG